MSGRFIAVVVAAWIGAVPVAWAHPAIDQARARFDRADLRGALQQLGRAEEADDLTRADVIALLELRALIRFTLGDVDAMEQDLARLVVIAPDHPLGAEAPPDLAEALVRVRSRLAGPLAVEVRTEAAPGGVVVRARVVNDPGSLVRRVVVAARAEGGAWVEGEGEVTVPAAQGAIEYAARAIGPGEAALVERGTRESPERVTRTVATTVETREEVLVSSGDDDDDGGIGIWPFVLAGVGAAAVVVVVIVLVAGGGGGGGDGNTDVQYPEVIW